MSNQIATAALAASVAAGAIGGLATYQAVSLGHRIDAQAFATADLRDRLQLATDAVATLRANIAEVNTADAAAIKALSKRITISARDIGLLGDAVAALPPSPNTTALEGRVSGLADETAAAATEAKAALAAAQTNANDPEARAAAKAASAAASDAGAKAEAARLAADEFAPHVYHFANINVPADTGTVKVGQIQTDFTGEYRITLSGDGQGYAYTWELDGATIYLHGTISEGSPQHQSGSTTYTFTGPLPIALTASATGGDSTDLSNIVLTLTKVRP